MRLLYWLLRGFIFFALFAFALNNGQPATLRWFFGVEWHAPMVIIVLAAFAAGCALGVFATLPGWWSRRRAARLRESATPPAPPPAVPPPSDFGPFSPTHPPREGL